MSVPEYNKHVLRRTPTCIDITDRFGLFVGEPIYLQLRDASTLSGRLTAIEEKDMRITIDTHAMGRKIIQVADIALTYFGPAAELQSAWQQWHNRQCPPPVHFRLKESEMDVDRGPEYKETGNIICAELYPTTPLDRHMAAVRRYLDGETATLDQALGLTHETPGKPKKHTSKALDTLCWKAFIRRELLEPNRPWRKVTAEFPDASDSSAFREAMAIRHEAMMARALRFAMEFDTSVYIKDPNLLKRNSPERKQAEHLLEQIENFL